MVVLQSGYFPLVFCFSSSSFNVYFDNSFYFLPLNPCGHVAPVQEPRVSGFSLASAPFDSAKSDLTAWSSFQLPRDCASYNEVFLRFLMKPT